MIDEAPKTTTVQRIVSKYFNNIFSVERVTKGTSTYVYCINAESGTYYARFLKEQDSFATEVLTHNLLHDAGVLVPKVIAYEHKNSETGRSFMLIDEIAGNAVEDDMPAQENLQDILRNAGRQLARIHSISVEGFGWIDKGFTDKLKGEKLSFREYFNEHLNNDLDALQQYSFTEKERTRIADLMHIAQESLDIKDAVLVHGDFDISQIFHSEGKYSGIIDFGEIRGNSRLFDFATFVGFNPSLDSNVYLSLYEGYCEMIKLTYEDFYAIELFALFNDLRFLGKKVNTNSREHWYNLTKKQLERINYTEYWSGLQKTIGY